MALQLDRNNFIGSEKLNWETRFCQAEDMLIGYANWIFKLGLLEVTDPNCFGEAVTNPVIATIKRGPGRCDGRKWILLAHLNGNTYRFRWRHSSDNAIRDTRKFSILFWFVQTVCFRGRKQKKNAGYVTRWWRHLIGCQHSSESDQGAYLWILIFGYWTI